MNSFFKLANGLACEIGLCKRYTKWYIALGMMLRGSFTLRVLAANFLLLALPLLIDSFIFFQNSYYETIRGAKKELREVTNLRTFGLVSSKPVKQVLLSELGYVIDISDRMEKGSFEALTRELVEIEALWNQYQIYVLELSNDGYHKIVASSNPVLVGTFFEAYDPFKVVIETGSGTFVRYVFSDETQDYVPYLFMAQVVTSKETGKRLGILMMSSNVESLLSTLLSPSPQLSTAKFAFLNGDGVVIESSDPRLMGRYFKAIPSKRRKQLLSSKQLGNLQLPDYPIPVVQDKDPSFFEFAFEGHIQIAYQVMIPEMKLSVVGYSPKEKFFSSAVRHFLYIYIIYSLILLIGGAVTYWLSLWISRPLRQLIHVMGEVRQGNVDVRFQEAPLGFEINILGQMFNHTLDNLLFNIQHAEDERVKKETYQRELDICREVQYSLLSPRLPESKAAMIAGLYLPASEVGGDFYYFYSKKSHQNEDMLAISVADVIGLGLSPCMYSLTERSLFRAYSTHFDDVGTIVNLTNHDFIRDIGEATTCSNLFLAFFHIDSNVLSYSICGTIPSMIKRKNGELIPLKQAGAAIGVNASSQYQSTSIPLYSGDILIAYTLGLLKITNSNQENLSENLLIEILQSTNWSTAQELVERVKTTIHEFTASIPQMEEGVFIALKID